MDRLRPRRRRRSRRAVTLRRVAGDGDLSDIETANRLAHEVLGRSLDELPPQTRRLLLLIDEAATRECQRLRMDRTDFRSSRREVRAWTEWGDTVLTMRLGRLEDLEYLLVHRGGRGQSFVYELMFVRGENPSNPRLPGLIEAYDLKKSPLKEEKSPSSRPQVVGVPTWRHAIRK
ncbi:MAG TPA: hypothetical protein VGZ73_23045 [Bryobacteraceae bacterium]|nr:hypothetical protein [Bryobacteraceae bacterium]